MDNIKHQPLLWVTSPELRLERNEIAGASFLCDLVSFEIVCCHKSLFVSVAVLVRRSFAAAMVSLGILLAAVVVTLICAHKVYGQEIRDEKGEE